jgi:AraC-like DNA-binding protein
MQRTKPESDNKFGFDKIIEGIRNLDDQALTQVAGEVTRLLSNRNTQPSSDREKELLKKIRTSIPSTIIRRQKQLYKKLQNDSLTLKEREELLLLNELLEEKSAERILFLGELAQLRGISVKQLATELKARLEDAEA